MKSKFVVFFAGGILMVCGSMFAHHGTGISYDMENSVTLTGTVTEFVWANPHCYLSFDVKDEKGNPVHWAGEMNSPGVLKQGGLSRTTFKAGDQITIAVHPSKGGTSVGVVDSSKPVMANGKVVLAARGNNWKQ